MSIANEQVKKLLKESMLELQTHLNSIEKNLLIEEQNQLSAISLSLGKAMKNYSEVAYYLGIFDNKVKF